MAKNSSYQTQLDGKSSGVISSSRINEPTKSYHQNTNTFNNDYQFLCTSRYGDITPFYVCNGIPKDVNPLISTHELRTYTLQSPLMSDVYMHKNYFQVPMKSILPRTWDYIFTNPVQGDDVPEAAYCSFPLMQHIREILSSIASNYNTSGNAVTSESINGWFVQLVRQMMLLESVLSSGSLLSYLGFSGHSVFRTTSNNKVKSFDNFFDICFIPVFDILPFFTLSFEGESIKYCLDKYETFPSGYRRITLRRFLELVRENPCFVITFNLGEDSASVLKSLNTFIDGFKVDLVALSQNFAAYTEHVDISRVIAYQLCCAHFFTNDNVDFVYSADLFRKNAESFFYKTEGTSGNTPNLKQYIYAFDYNGVKVPYDVFSGYVFNKIFGHIKSYGVGKFISAYNRDESRDAFAFLSLVFAYRKSLRFGDYFTGSRPFPLAVGDVSAPVKNNGVSAIDMTVNISKQRFLNAVNRFGASVDDYISGIFGSKLPPVDDDPKWLANQSFQLFGTEIENTGSEQRDSNSVTTLIKSNGGKYAFEAYCDVPSIFIGLSWFEFRRVYTTVSDRHFFHKDRFDMFNPFFQYIGDQEILPKEISASNESSNAVGYTTRFMEYKQRVSRAVGGFANDALRSWATVVSFDDDGIGSGAASSGITISPDFIRSTNSEFDPYYTSLTGYSLGNYFHFIVKHNNFNSISRAMDYSPTIL